MNQSQSSQFKHFSGDTVAGCFAKTEELRTATVREMKTLIIKTARIFLSAMSHEIYVPDANKIYEVCLIIRTGMF